MTRHRQHPKAVRYLICSALAAALVTGCAATGKFAHSTPKAPEVAPLSDSAADRAVVALLGAGFRMESFPILVCWDRPFADFARYLPISPGLL